MVYDECGSIHTSQTAKVKGQMTKILNSRKQSCKYRGRN